MLLRHKLALDLSGAGTLYISTTTSLSGGHIEL
jgi:hypothetical protein